MAENQVEARKENGVPPKIEKVEDDDYDPYGLSSSDEDDAPPPIIEIAGRESDVKKFKDTFASAEIWEKTVTSKEAADLEGIGKENLCNLKENFEAANKEEQLPKEPKQKLENTGVDQEKYSKFKSRFEKEMDSQQDVVDDDENAVVKEPEAVGEHVVRSGLKSQEDFSTIGSLSNRKETWESSVEAAQKTEKLTKVADEEIAASAGRVKSNLTKFIEDGGSKDEEEEDEDSEAEGTLDPNITRGEKKRRKREKLHFEQVGELKNKWKAGEVEGPQATILEDRTDELEEIKKGVKVKERFREKTGQEDEQDELEQNRPSVMEKEAIDTSLSAEAMQRFKKGEAFEEGPVQKTAIEDIKFTEMGNVKEKFEKGEMDLDEMRVKTEVDAKCAELGNLKAAFEQGLVSNVEERQLMREERRRHKIDAEFQRYKAMRRKQELKEQRETETAQQNNLPSADDQLEEIRKNTEMSSIKQRFEAGELDENNMDKKPLEIEISADTKNLKSRFEGAVDEAEDIDADEKKRLLEEEFKKYKELKEQNKDIEGEMDEVVPTKEEIQVAADHAKKMTQKWEKIERKEAKKAQKSLVKKPAQGQDTPIQ